MYNSIMSDEILQYRQCPCCGNYFTVGNGSDNAKTIFCSPECRVVFRQCCVCGNWYEADKGYVPDENAAETENNLCSEECAKVLLGHHRKG